MASVWRRGGSKARGTPYCATFIDRNGRRTTRSTDCTDREAARKLAAKWEQDEKLIAEGVVSPEEDGYRRWAGVPLSQHVADYLEACAVEGQVPLHLKIKRSQLTKLIAAAKAKAPCDLDANRFMPALRALIDKKRSARTHNQYRQTLLTFARWMVEAKRLRSHGLDALPKRSESDDKRRPRRAATEAELQAILTEPRVVASGRRTFYATLALTGARVGSAKGLRWSDVNLTSGTIALREQSMKSRKALILPLHPDLADELRRYKPAGAEPGDLVFPQPPTIRTFKSDLKRAGVPFATPDGRLDRHSLRVSVASILAGAGAPPVVVSRLLGHATTAMTERFYTRVQMQQTAAALNLLPSLPPAGEGAQRQNERAGVSQCPLDGTYIVTPSPDPFIEEPPCQPTQLAYNTGVDAGCPQVYRIDRNSGGDNNLRAISSAG